MDAGVLGDGNRRELQMERLPARKRLSAVDRQSVQRREAVASVTNGAELAGMAPPLPTLPAATSAGLLSAACGVLDKLNRGVVIIDGRATVLFANRAARAMLQRRNGLAIDNDGCLRFMPVEAAEALTAYLLARQGNGESGSLVLRLPCSQGRHPYRVLVSRLETVQHVDHPSHCVLIYEPGGGQRPLPLDVLRELYGLTPAEARIVNALFTGQSLTQTAHTLGISVLTARTTLKHVFSKCEVGGQAELMLLVSLGPRTV
jgi:DNA-binding CsgD family transcriptional regulator